MHLSRHAAPSGLVLALVLLARSMWVSADDHHRPQPFVAVYKVEASGVKVGRMTRTLEFDADGSYRFTAVVESEGLVALLKPTRIAEESSGRWQDAYPLPLRYVHDKRSGKKRKETRLEFDWAAGRSRGTVNGIAIEAVLEQGAIDKLSYQLALMRDLAAGVSDLQYRVADVGGAKSYRLERRADERVRVAGVDYDTVPVAYERDDGRRTVLWCAPTLGYLPVRIEYTEKDGQVTTAELSSR